MREKTLKSAADEMYMLKVYVVVVVFLFDGRVRSKQTEHKEETKIYFCVVCVLDH